jgi:hypothetical protein
MQEEGDGDVSSKKEKKKKRKHRRDNTGERVKKAKKSKRQRMDSGGETTVVCEQPVAEVETITLADDVVATATPPGPKSVSAASPPSVAMEVDDVSAPLAFKHIQPRFDQSVW